MPETQVSARDPGTLVLSGPLVFDSAAAVLRAADERLRAGHHDTLDLEAVTNVDSAGLALVLAVMATARCHGARLKPVHLPADLVALARVCEVDALLA